MARGCNPYTPRRYVFEEDRHLDDSHPFKSCVVVRTPTADEDARMEDLAFDAGGDVSIPDSKPRPRKGFRQQPKPTRAEAARQASVVETEGVHVESMSLRMRSGTVNLELLIDCVLDVERYPVDEKDTLLVWPGVEGTRREKIEALSLMLPKHRKELQRFIDSLRRPTDDDLGKSNSPSSSDTTADGPAEGVTTRSANDAGAADQ